MSHRNWNMFYTIDFTVLCVCPIVCCDIVCCVLIQAVQYRYSLVCVVYSLLCPIVCCVVTVLCVLSYSVLQPVLAVTRKFGDSLNQYESTEFLFLTLSLESSYKVQFHLLVNYSTYYTSTMISALSYNIL